MTQTTLEQEKNKENDAENLKEEEEEHYNIRPLQTLTSEAEIDNKFNMEKFNFDSNQKIKK